MRPNLALLLAVLLFILSVPMGLAAPPDEADEADDRLDWWREARFGLFIHWGLYAIPAGEWKGTSVPGVGEWIMHNGKIPPAEYAALVPQFNAVKFDADEWCRIAKDAGMKYLVITTKHHDGFCLFDSQHSDFDIMATPFKRDIMHEISDACRRHGLRLGWYHSIWDWSHPDASGERFDEYAVVLKAQVDELLTNYGPIDIMWFDGEWIPEWSEEKGRDLYEHIRRVAPRVIINNRVGKGRGGMAGLHNPEENVGDFGTPEQEIPGRGIPGYDWETCMTMNDTWGFRRDDHNWKLVTTLVRNLIDTASKGGNFLLNVGPTAEGLIPQSSVERLAAVGAWLRVNGESIYGTQAGPFKRLEWGRCTRKGDRLYLHVFDWPGGGVLEVPGLRNQVTHARLVGSSASGDLRTRRQEDSLLIHLPPRPVNDIASVVAIDIVGEPDIAEVFLRQRADGSIVLRAFDAEVIGFTARYESGNGKDNIGFWTDPADVVTWRFEVTQPGRFEVIMSQACPADAAGAQVAVAVAQAELTSEVQPTSGWTDFIDVEIGEIEIPARGMWEVRVQARSRPALAVMNLRSVTLRPVETR